VIALLQAGKGQNAESLAESLGVSRRTIFRDIEVLRLSGLPVSYDQTQNQYSISSPFSLPAMHFTPEEALALIVICHGAGGRHGLNFLQEAAQTASLKLESLLPSPLREELRGKTGRIHVRLHPRADLNGKAEIFPRLVDAMHRQHLVEVKYDSATDRKLLKLRLSPYQLYFTKHSWYVIGRSSLHREIRTFHVGRIAELHPVHESFHLPHNFNLDSYFKSAWHMIPDGPDQEVIVRFLPLVARNVAQVGWHKSQKLIWNDDGSLDFHVTVSGLKEMSWWILGYGDQAEVLHPPEMREILHRHAQAMLKIYSGQNGEPPRLA
jgi:predicted DNA-binding transcriptional regulator YafY